MPPGGYGEGEGNGRQRRQLQGGGGNGNPFWSERALDQHELRMARPAHLPEMENTPDLLNFDEELFGDVETSQRGEDLPPVQDDEASRELQQEEVRVSRPPASWEFGGGLMVMPGWPAASAGQEVPTGVRGPGGDGGARGPTTGSGPGGSEMRPQGQQGLLSGLIGGLESSGMSSLLHGLGHGVVSGQGQHPGEGHHWGRVQGDAQWRGSGALHPGQLHGEGGERAQPSARRQEEVGDRAQLSGQVQGEGVGRGRPSVHGLRTEGALPGDRDLRGGSQVE